MCNLERISEEIHEQRRPSLPPREPGVGCESDEDFPSEINLGMLLQLDAASSRSCLISKVTMFRGI